MALKELTYEEALATYDIIDLRVASTDKLIVVQMSESFSDYNLSEKIWFGEDLKSFGLNVYNDVVYGQYHPKRGLEIGENIIKRFKDIKKGVIVLTYNHYLIESLETFGAINKVLESIQWCIHKGDKFNEFECYDIKHNTEMIYRQYADPLQDLETLRWTDHKKTEYGIVGDKYVGKE